MQAFEVGLLEPQVGFGDLDLGARSCERCESPVVRRPGQVELVHRRDLPRDQGLPALEDALGLDDGGLGLVHTGLGGIERGAGALDRRLELVGVELGQHLAGLDRGVVVDQHLADDAGELARHLDLIGRLDAAGRRDDHLQAAAGDGHGHIARGIAGSAPIEQQGC